MWPNPQETMDLATFTEEIVNGKLHFYKMWPEKLCVSNFFAHAVYNEKLFLRKEHDANF